MIFFYFIQITSTTPPYITQRHPARPYPTRRTLGKCTHWQSTNTPTLVSQQKLHATRVHTRTKLQAKLRTHEQPNARARTNNPQPNTEARTRTKRTHTRTRRANNPQPTTDERTRTKCTHTRATRRTATHQNETHACTYSMHIPVQHSNTACKYMTI